MPNDTQKPTANGGGTVEQEGLARPFGLPRWVSALLPLILLAIIVGLFAATSPFASFQAGQPLPDVTVTNVELPNQEVMILHVTNNGPEPVTISQVLVDEAYWNYKVMQGGQEVQTIGPRESARVIIPYHWTTGWDFEVALVLQDGATVHHTIVAASQTPGFSLDVLWTLAVIGLFVGVIPVALGMLWFPFIRTMSDRWLHAVLAFAAGVLAFLAFDAGFEAFEIAERVPGFLDGRLLVVLGILGALLLVQSVSSWREGRAAAGDERATSGLWLAYLVALGIGLHNLAEGLAIGSAFAIGRVSLGAFLVIGFMLHNVTEGPAVIAPVARDERPALWHFGALGVLAGAPVILGGWIGGLAYSPTLGALFLAIGVGAILQVIWELTKLVRRDGGRVSTALNLLALGGGLGIMYVTDLFVTL
jgi:zinc transporter ZupT